MNNNQLVTNNDPDVSPVLREREAVLTETIDALQNIGSSSYWKILQRNVFDVELVKSKKRLEVESDTTEIFRLQGETRLGRRYHLDRLITKYRNELQAIRKKLI